VNLPAEMPMMERIAGLYVVQFRDHVKIGRSKLAPPRLRAHAQAGAQRIRLFFGPEAIVGAEAPALRVAAKLGRLRVGSYERFDGLTFDHASTVVGIAAAHVLQRVAQDVEIDVGRLLAYPARLVPLTVGNDTRAPQHKTQGPWLTRAEAARRLRVDVRTIDRWVQGGHLIRYNTPGGHARFKAEDVDRLLREDT